MANILYLIIIYPISQIMEFFYLLCNTLTRSFGFSVIGFSICVSFLCLPLYIIAEKWQRIERETVKRLKPKADSIKAVFKGDEQYMILSAYYRQNSYHPLYSLRSSFGILVQVPFFIAAYSFLSNLEIIKETGFLFINDLGKPDGLLNIGGFQLNLLPILMTLINAASGIIYTKNLSVRDKVQAFGMAAVFLPLLYNSPSSLVIYWTMNNLFSLVKNIFYKIKNPKKILYILSCIAVIFLDIYLIFFHGGYFYKKLVMIIGSLFIPAIPLLIKLFNLFYNKVKNANKFPILILSLIVLCILLGFVTPSFLISYSPQEFSYIDDVASPFTFLFNSTLQAIGLCVFLPVCLYFLFGERIKTLLTLIAVLFCWTALVNTFLFSGNYGEISSMLTFSNAGIVRPNLIEAVINLSIMLLIIALAICVLIKFSNIIIPISIILIISLIGISISHSLIINREYIRLTEIFNETKKNVTSEIEPFINLSKDQKNVVIIFLDRGINGFIPEIFKESPELYEQFSGFTYYPNTISFAGHTIMGVPPLMGGYEYTPKEINKRSNVPLVQKHNESLLLMPLIFSKNNYDVTLTDPPWADYSIIPDIRIFKSYPDLNVLYTIGAYTDKWLARNEFADIQIKSSLLKHNFIIFSLFKASPLVLREVIYKNGEWWNSNFFVFDFMTLINNFSVLDLLPELTDTNKDIPSFTILMNELTHCHDFLQAPDYIPSSKVTNYGTSKYYDNYFYHVNKGAIKRIGVWLEHLKTKGVYDNTRIIIASDHGIFINFGFFAESDHIPFNKETFYPLLLVKDFDADFAFQTDNSFMTNADVPTLAFNGLIDNPINPFTGNSVDNLLKKDVQYITSSWSFMPNLNSLNTFNIEPDQWYTVHTDIFNPENWQKAE